MYRVASTDDLSGDPRAEHPWTNRLVDSASAHLQRHAHNPVDWYPWGEEAFAAARERDVPLFLSIGYSACHWCQVMERESFSDPGVAAFLNAHFVPVKVDRDEHPEVDALYTEALLAIQGQAGWPASLFLLPSLLPFSGTTYLPPVERYGLPSFQQVLERVRELWLEERSDLEESGRRLLSGLSERPAPAEHRGLAGYADAVQAVVQLVDSQYGGFGEGAKFPQAPLLELLLLGAHDDLTHARAALQQTLKAMDEGALQDPLGGGFHRYCVDRKWTVPQFEKLLSDNAQLLRVYARASSVFAGLERKDAYEEVKRATRVVRDTVAFLLRELQGDNGAFFTSQDADDAGGEGTFYTFTPAELREALGEVASLPYGVLPGGNHERGRSVLNTRGGRPPRSIRDRLLAYRNRRLRPVVDRKQVVAYNGLVIGALSEAGRLFGFDDWVDAARRAAASVLEQSPGRALGAEHPGTLVDAACLASGLLDLYQARPWEERWLVEALRIAEQAVARFGDETPGLTAAGRRPDLVVARRDAHDGALPSGNGRMAEVLVRLLAYGADVEPALESILTGASGLMVDNALATPELWGAIRHLHAVDPPAVVVIAGTVAAPTTRALVRAYQRRWRPGFQVAVVAPDSSLGSQFALLRDKPGTQASPQAYVCRRGQCAPPLAQPSQLEDELERTLRD